MDTPLPWWRIGLAVLVWVALWSLTPGLLAVALPFHYELPLPVGLYMGWMAVSVLWQQYLTFGLLQDHLRSRLPAWATIVTVSAIFALGHVVWLPHRFGVGQPLAALAMVALGIVIDSLRTRFGALHVPLALHLAFYYGFA